MVSFSRPRQASPRQRRAAPGAAPEGQGQVDLVPSPQASDRSAKGKTTDTDRFNKRHISFRPEVEDPCEQSAGPAHHAPLASLDEMEPSAAETRVSDTAADLEAEHEDMEDIEWLKEMRSLGRSALEMKSFGASAKSLRAAGFTARHLRLAAFSHEQLEAAGYTPAAINLAGFGETLQWRAPNGYVYTTMWATQDSTADKSAGSERRRGSFVKESFGLADATDEDSCDVAADDDDGGVLRDRTWHEWNTLLAETTSRHVGTANSDLGSRILSA